MSTSAGLRSALQPGENRVDWCLGAPIGASGEQPSGERTWRGARSHHDVIERDELLALGYTPKAIRHRLAHGPLYPTGFRSIYAAGRPTLTRRGRWYAAT